MEISCEYQRSLEDNARVTLMSKKFPMISDKTNFNNDLVKFVSVNATKGIMNFYILINSRKVRSKDRAKDNCLKIALKDVGTKAEKKFVAKTIVNDIKIDLSIHLIPKIMNYTKNKSNEIKITIKPKQLKNERKDKERKIETAFPFRRKQTTEVRTKIPILKRNVRAITIANKMRSKSGIREKKSNTFYKPPQKVKESHEDLKKGDDMFSLKFPFFKKKSSETKKENTKKDETNRLRAMHKSNYAPEKNKTLKEIISAEKTVPKRLKTEKTEEIILQPVNYEKYLSENKQKNKNIYRETFCEGFFISSFPYKDGQVVEKSQSFPASCGHKECSSLPAMKPEIIVRYPLEDTKTLELNNLAATICFPTGIKVCYSENEPEIIKDYVTSITNQKGERYHMTTFHFYLKISNDIYSKNYEMHPLKHHLMKFADNYLNLSEDEMDKEVTEEIQNNLEQAQNLGFRDNVFVPFCICLISKYPYVKQMKKCLQSIYNLLIKNIDNLKDEKEKSKLNNLIMHIINSVPIPDIGTTVQFYIPYFSNGIELRCPKLDDLNIMNTKISDLLKIFSIDYICVIFRFLIFEKKILFIDEDYTRLSNVSSNFISLLYPFQWMHTYIPIMSDQMLKYLETFLPFVNGINLSLMPLVTDLFKTGDMEEGEEMFLVYINISKFKLGSTLVGKNLKKYKYIEDNIPALPYNLEKELKNKLKKIKDDIDAYQKKNPNNADFSEFDLKIRDAFIEMFVQMFHDIEKYLCFLDQDVVFNKNLFLETVPKEDKKFYDEFIDTQLFQLFSQNFVSDEFNYFKSMMTEYNKNKKFLNDNINEEPKKYIKKVYILNPDYLDIKEKNKKNIEIKMNEKYSIKKEEKDEDGLILNQKKITEYMQNIDNYKYINKDCNIYLMPDKYEKKPSTSGKNRLNLLNDMLTKDSNPAAMSQFKKYARTKTYKNDMSEKEKDEIKEKIKDFTIKIFKSEEIEQDDRLKKDLQNDINTNFGRDFFVNLLAKNTSNVILLKDNSFNLLGTLIYNTLLFILQVEENSKILQQIAILIKSMMFLGKEEKETVGYILTSEKKSTVTLWNKYKQKIQGYPKISQSNLWNIWYGINLNEEKEKESEEVKKKVLLQLCDLMIELELVKSFIKNTLEKLVKKVFNNNDEKSKAIMQDIVQKIIKTKYISKSRALE